MALLKKLASSPLLPNPGEYKHGSLVFFDFLGYFVVQYSARLGNIINVLTLTVVFVGIGRKAMGHTIVYGNDYYPCK